MKVIEGINDKNLLKAIFLAGGPGSGKSFVVNQMFGVKGGISPFGIKIVNSDFFFELGLAKQGLPTVMDANNPELYNKQMAIRSIAKKKAEIKKGYHIDSLLPIIIDGTGKDYDKITQQALYLQSKGYDTAMIFVNTSLQVALERNAARKRTVDPSLVEKMWNGVQNNMGKFQSFFKNGFTIIDNNAYFEKDSIESDAFSMSLFSVGKKMIEEPLKSSVGNEIISVLRATGGKYLSDLPEDY